ncbi:hypothetical protein MMA231_02519 [Asticcacaulis sp. MM231]|uniref:recombinase family protein n=1 Tax=Asticcacaulis sp. MM231 TaxID=3157666 RepID=UPI0032D58D1A
MTNRAVIYSRFSTDLQNEKSIEHQEAVARAFAVRAGFSVVGAYSDAAMSGASILGRDGLLELLTDAKRGQFDVVIVEHLDRLSRDMEDMAGIHKRLTFAGISIVSIHEGKASTMDIGLRGLVGQLFREDNVHKTKRGMQGKVSEGLLASGKSYGYRMDAANKGLPIIVQEEADVVRRIFTDYVAGKSPQKIAVELNAEGLPSPRGNGWAGNTIYGWEKTGVGILRNQLYAGRIVWNRNRWIKDPDTGRRVSRTNPPEEWIVKEAPQYRIVDQAVFDAAQAICSGRVMTRQETGHAQRPKRLLSGLLKCGACGGGMSAYGAGRNKRPRIMCSNHRDGKHCPDPRTFYLDTVEKTVIEKMRSELTNPEMLVDYVTAYNQTRQELARGAARRRNMLEKKVTDLDGRIRRIMELLIAGVGDVSRLGEEMKAKQTEYEEAKAEFEREPAPLDAAALHPQTIKRYEMALTRLNDEIHACVDGGSPVMGELMRELVNSITLYPDAQKPETPGVSAGGLIAVIQGKLRILLDEPAPAHTVCGSLVAGARFELTTFRL